MCFQSTIFLLLNVIVATVTGFGWFHHGSHNESAAPNVPLDTLEFILYTKEHKDVGIPATLNETNVLFGSAFQPNQNVKIIIHGWRNNRNSPISQTIKNEYLRQNQNVNVIVTDWSFDSYKNYITARYDVSPVGNHVAKFIQRLQRERNIDITALHIIGHSLGAHVAGIAGNHFSDVQIGRITGLDPANPLFLTYNKNRISKDSAKFVDIIHTSDYMYGMPEPLGHVDFFPNGGTPSQPGCNLRDILGKCSHGRAVVYYAESINDPTGFIAHQCKTWAKYTENDCIDHEKAYMGEGVSVSSSGTYFLRTGLQSPFALHDKY